MAQLMNLHEFLDDFLERGSKASNRIYIQTMVIAEGPVLNKVMDVLIPAKKRGVDVRFHIDSVYSRYYHGQIDLLPQFDFEKRRSYKEAQTKNKELFNLFSKHSIDVQILNQPNVFEKILPILGRNHIKIYVVDNVVWLGGLNLYDESFENLDLMVRYEDPRIVNAVVEQFMRINERSLKQDAIFPLTQTETLLIDCGKRNSSIILDTAVELTSQITNTVVYLSQMVPEGTLLATLIEKAKEGKKINIFTSTGNEDFFTKFPTNIPYVKFKKVIQGIPNITVTHFDKRVHGKMMIFDSKQALFGSHNFVDTGVKLGTNEICMWTKDTSLIHELEGIVSL